jgi:peptide/nickel transport system permease protein
MVSQYWLASEWRLFPVWGFESARYLVLPVLVGVVAGVGGSVRFYRTVMLDEMYQEYVRTARAKGLGPRTILFRHVLRNAMIPILTNVIVAIPFLYTGALLLENFFGIPGLGRLTVTALFVGDEDVIFATTFLGAILFVVANAITDIAYTWADPRIRLR